MKQKTLLAVTLLLSAFFSTSCSDHDDDNGGGNEAIEVKTATVAVLCNSSDTSMYNNVLKMFNKNALEAATGDTLQLQLALEFVDEDKLGSYTSAVQPLFHKDYLSAVIVADDEVDNKGLTNVYKGMADKTAIEDVRPLIFPLPASSKLQQTLCTADYAWFLSCNNLDEADCQMRYIKSIGKERVVIVASQDDYGLEATENIGRAAKINGLTVAYAITMVDVGITSEVKAEMGDIYRNVSQRDKCAVVVATSYEPYYTIFDKLRETDEEVKAFDTYVFSHNACSPSNATQYKNAVGTTMVADRNSEFAKAYKAANGSEPCYGEAQIYDALMLAYLSAYAKRVQQSDQNATIRQLLTEKVYDTWQASGIRQARQYLASKAISRSVGATGNLTIDTNHKNLIKSSYCIWSSKNGQFTLDTSYADNSTDIVESHDGENWALVVCGSYQWENYRHIADALNVVNMLINKGYKRDHIITVIDTDKILNSSDNPHKGEIRLTPDGDNIYKEDYIDYQARQLLPDDIGKLMAGDNSMTPSFNPGKNDNVFIFWSGHGNTDNGLKWMDDSYVTKRQVNEWITKLKARDVNRVMLVVEACFSGQIADEVKQKDVFVIAASTASQESFVYEKAPYPNYGYMQDAFTHAFVNYVTANPKASLYDLYNAVYMNVGESNVTISNPAYYSNLKSSSISDFLAK